MQQILTEADLAYGDLADLAMQMSDFVFPYASFNEEAKKLNELALRATHVAQPAIGAVSLGMVCVLTAFGAHPAMAAGHSFGELVALFTGGRITSGALHDLAKLRGRLMAEVSNNAGTMIAVQASESEVAEVLKSEGIEAVIANKNAPRQVVVSGTNEQISRASEAFKKRQISSTALPVGAAFHSPLVAGAATPFREALGKIPIQSGAIPVYANTTAEPYPAGENSEDAVRDLLAGQLAQSVEFCRQILRMHEDGATTFVEVGPGNKLTGLVKAILGEGDYHAFAVDASAGKNDGVVDFARALAQLAALGHGIDLTAWEPCNGEDSGATTAKPRMTVKLTGANYRNPAKVKETPKLIAKVKTSATNGETASAAALPTAITPPVHSVPLEKTNYASTFTSAPPPHIQPPPPKGESKTMSSHSSIRPLTSSVPPPQSSSTISDARLAALKTAQENLLALQRLQEQTAQLHRQFLEGQQSALASFARLAEQQQHLLAGTPVSYAPQPTQMAMPAQVKAPAPQLPSTKPISPIDPSSPILSASPTAQEPQAPAMPAVPQQDKIKETLIGIVAERTGYPAEMLNVQMDLESDLGIDSIKRVEILSALQERMPELPALPPEQAGTLRTLEQIAAFLGESLPQTVGRLLRADEKQANVQESAKESRSTINVSSRGQQDSLAPMLLEIVGEKTGYPVEMLNLQMDLESDLGIDSIKRVEILSAVQERRPDLPALQPEEAGKLRTLEQVIAVLSAGIEPPSEQASSNGHSANGHVHATPIREEQASSSHVALSRITLEAEPIEETNGHHTVHLPEGGEIWISEGGSKLAEALALRLSGMGFQPRVVASADAEKLKSDPPPCALILVAGDHAPETATWKQDAEIEIKNVFKLAQVAAQGLHDTAGNGGALFASITRLDGAFGLNGGVKMSDPIQGALAGLVKTAKHEWPGVACKAIDVDPDWRADDELAETLVHELFRGGPIEVGLSKEKRVAIREVADNGAGEPNEKLLLSPGEVVVVTGGARGVTAEVALALAESFHPTLALIGRSEAPIEEPAWLRGLTVESEIKRAVASNLNGHGSNPKAVEREYRKWAANREVAENIRRIESAGSRVIYRSADLRDADSVAQVIRDIEREAGPIRGLVHGAGVLADRMITDKTPEQFESVFDTKVAGLRHILSALESADLKTLVLFSSVSGRYGRKGQSDYAMANEALNKIARLESVRRPSCKVLSVAWGPWAGGMVNESLRKVFESEGHALIPLREGGLELVREMRRKDSPVEVVIAAQSQMDSNELLDRAFGITLDVASHPFLRSHVINGSATLPAAVTLEWLAHAALHENPGLVFQGVNDLKIFKGVILGEGDSADVELWSGKAKLKGETLVAIAELRGTSRRNGQGSVLHARAEILIGERPAHMNGTPPLEPVIGEYTRSADSHYENHLFHGEHFRAIGEITAFSKDGIAARIEAEAQPEQWMREQPLAIDACLQLGLLWTREAFGDFSLPSSLETYRQFNRQIPSSGLRAILRGQKSGAQTARADVDLTDAEGNVVAILRGAEFVLDPSLAKAFRLNALQGAASA